MLRAQADSAGASAPLAKAAIGGYQLERVLGSGGMGVVWAGTDRERARAFAIKLLRSAGDAAERAVLLDRVRAAAAVRHPGLVPIFEVGCDEGRDFIAMELAEGQSVADWLATRPAQREVLATMLEAGRALEAAHQRGVTHRNFNLHNILRSDDGRVRVTDLGLARGHLAGASPPVLSAVAVAQGGLGAPRELPRQEHPILDASLTQDGVFVGTPGYMAPELFADATPDTRSDQFAFCVALWEAMSGRRPFQADTLEGLQRAVRAGEAQGGEALPARLRAALLRGLAVEPARRWPDLSKLLAELGRVSTVRARPLLLGAAAALALATLGAVALLARRDASGASQASAAGLAACEPSERAFAPVWSVARGSRLIGRHGAGQVSALLARLEDVRREWSTAYGAACASAALGGAGHARACLIDVRDRAAVVMTRLESQEGPPAVGSLEPMLPEIAACQQRAAAP